MLIARVLAFVSVFGFNAVLARCLVPADFGLFALLFSLATLTSLLASCGMNRALVKVLASESSHDAATLNRVVKLGVYTSIIAGLIVGAIALTVCANFLPSSGETSWLIACMFGGIVLVRNVHFVLAETTRGFHETRWSNLFGGPAGGPIPHLIFLCALIGFWQTTSIMSLAFVLCIYLVCLLVSLPPLVWKLYSLRNQTVRSAFVRTTGSTTDLRESTAPPKQSAFTAKSIWVLAIPLMLTQTFGLTLSQADIWMAGVLVLPAVSYTHLTLPTICSV